MNDFPLRRVQSAKINNLCKLCPTLSSQYQSTNQKNSLLNNPNVNNINNDSVNTDQHTLNEQRQKISQQILMARSQVVPLRQKAAELSEKMKFLHPNLLFEVEEPETPETLLFSRLGTERIELEENLKHLEDLASIECQNKFENDINRYRTNLETIKDLIQRGSETLIEKRNSFDVIIHSEIYSRVIEQRNTIETLQRRLNELIEEAHEINENTSSQINEIPEIRKLNQKVMFLQKRLCSLKHEKNFKMDELARMRNTRTTKRSPRAKSRRRMNSGIELKKRKQQQLQHQQRRHQIQTPTLTSSSISQLPLLPRTNILSHSMRSRDFSEIFQPSAGIRKSNSNSDIAGNGFNFNDSDLSDNDSVSENNNDEVRQHIEEPSNSESDNYYSYYNNNNNNKIDNNDKDEKTFDSSFSPKRDTRRNSQENNNFLDDDLCSKAKKNEEGKHIKNRPNLKISIESPNTSHFQFYDYENDENCNDDNEDKSASGGCLSPISEPDNASQQKSPRVVRFAFEYETHQNQ
ncbi:hypothetical protein M9Y10_001104 [Tritrichomonas musculus]|uniref:Uncharacterized protein n=1 Tax=Tritrichomonas musculus TaxID=1915356 RepID=A0ABR2L6C0_9EUKA